MKFNKKYLLLSCLTFFLLSSTILGVSEKTTDRSATFNETISFLPSFSYTDHGAIEIANDGDFGTSDAVSAGDGTEGDPYIIEGWNITVATGHGIYIHDVTAYFIVRNCWIDAGVLATGDFDSGILVKTVVSGIARVENNTCVNSNVGIYFSSVDNGTIIDNNCTDNSYGIYAFDTEYLTILNNTCVLNSEMGIYLYNSDSNSVENNDCDSNSDGILLEESKNNNVTSNRCSINGNAGIKLQQSSSNLIVDNLCTYNDGSGVYLTNSNNNNVCNNTFYSNSEGSFYLSDSDYNYMFNNTCNSSASGFQLRGSSFNSLVRNTCKNMEGNGIRLTSNSANNSLIENQLLSNVYGAYITNSNNNSLLSNSFINNSYTGIHLEFSSNNLIDNNDLSNNGDFGLNLYSSSNNTIINNIINDHDLAGIETYLSNYSYIENNYCSYNGQSGIKLDASFYNEAYNNTLTGHIIAGIHLSANFSIILDNVLVNNSRGIRIGGSYNNTIAFNLIKENWYYGIDIYTESENNTLHHNIFLNNNSPAIDAGANNTWYDKTTNEGNWWSTYSGTGNFTIHGSADSVDLYPFAIVLLLEHYFTANIEYGTPDNAIDWTITSAFEVSELKPLNYIIYNNGTEMDSGVLTDTYDVIYIAGGAEIGVHNYTIVVTDYLNNKAIDTAFVIVSDSTDPIISSPADISYFDGVFSTTIEWTATDLDAGTYMVYMNDTVFTSTTTWTSGEVIELVTYYLPSGIYNFTIVVSDASGNFGTDMVTITVIANLAPVISSPADITYVVGSTGNIISWTATDIDADSYYIRRNGTQIQLSQEWISGTAITFNVDGLEEGVYEFSCVAFDQNGNTASDTVIVTVTTSDPKDDSDDGNGVIIVFVVVVVALGGAGAGAFVYMKKK